MNRALKLPALLLASVGLTSFATADELYEAKPLVEGITTKKTEGPVCDLDGNLYFVNMKADGDIMKQGNIGKVTPDGQAEIFATLPEGNRGNGMRFLPSGNLVIADQLGGTILELNPETKDVNVYYEFPEGSGEPNDIALRSDGTMYVSFWKGGLWIISPDKEGEKLFDGYFNGIDLSPDEKTLYSFNKSYDVQEDGSLTNGRKLLEVPPRSEGEFSWDDGIRTDAAGNIFMARFGGVEKSDDGKRKKLPGAIHIFSPDGKLVRNVMLPASDTTNLAFGGPDGKTVFVTHPGPDGMISTFRTEHPGRSWEMMQQ